MEIDFASGSCSFPLGTCDGWAEVCGEVSAPWTVTSCLGVTPLLSAFFLQYFWGRLLRKDPPSNARQYLLSQLTVVVEYFMQVSHLPQSDLRALWSWVEESSKLCTNILISLCAPAAAASVKGRNLQALFFFSVQDNCQKYNTTPVFLLLIFSARLLCSGMIRLSLLSLWRCTLLWKQSFDSLL